MEFRSMLDSTNSRRSIFDAGEDRSAMGEPWRDGVDLRILLTKVRQQKRRMRRSVLVGSIIGLVGGMSYDLVRIPAYSASSELLISNTTLQLSGPDAVVTQVLVENSLIQSAIEMLKASKVLDRVIDRMGVDNIEQVLPKSGSIRRFASWLTSASDRESSRRQAAAALVRYNTSVNRVGASQVISVQGRALNAEDAARLANELAAAFVQEQNDTNAVVTTSAALRERIRVLGPTARIISEAVAPNSRDGPALGIVLGLAAALGGVLGMTIQLALISFGRRVCSAEQLVAATGVECFGYLPRRRRGGTIPRYGGGADLASVLGGSILRRARLAILERSERNPHFVGVTSVGSGEGKTFLARSWARLIAHDGSRVLLVDASHGAAVSAKSVRPAKGKGLHELLRGEANLVDVVQGDSGHNLHFLPSGGAVCSLDMLWLGFVELINGGHDPLYDWIVIDLPPLATPADVRSAGQIVDDFLIVVEWDRTSERQLEQAFRDLGPMRERIRGTVINKTPWSSFDSVTLEQAARRASRPKWNDQSVP
ncbi:AAA family ATPase [Bradyrhizobium huanghuaihaiense]|uniref:tyrosine-protein kinase domain-containing protein n=1 Tax=Bradyrhizobium huanghuaihaiense TaxID=990078 RepID=UPI0021AA14D6|nr:tyrosine-protein kinase domain-containing protein [Bradyrhizobium sp. CB3035]UWU74823.1 AAA family ATPase [Bradyrhizobium sp. CB3035]